MRRGSRAGSASEIPVTHPLASESSSGPAMLIMLCSSKRGWRNERSASCARSKAAPLLPQQVAARNHMPSGSSAHRQRRAQHSRNGAAHVGQEIVVLRNPEQTAKHRGAGLSGVCQQLPCQLDCLLRRIPNALVLELLQTRCRGASGR